jgi:hypothetical protein
MSFGLIAGIEIVQSAIELVVARNEIQKLGSDPNSGQ